MVPTNLKTATDNQLYDALDTLRAHREREGRGRTPEATYVREFCREEKRSVQNELRRRGLPTARPDGRAYGPGRAAWQRARP